MEIELRARLSVLLPLALLCLSCSEPAAPSGPFTGTWVFHGADSSSNYYDLILNHTGTRVEGRFQMCRPTLCALGPVDGQYADSAFTYQIALVYFPATGATACQDFIARLVRPDTLIGVLRNFERLGSADTMLFQRTTVDIPVPIVPTSPFGSAPPPPRNPCQPSAAGQPD